MRNFISKSLALSLYKSLIEPDLLHADIVYDRCSISAKRDLQGQHNNTLGAVMNVDNNNNITYNMYSLSNVIMADENWISFHQYLRYSHKRGTIMFSAPSAII